MIVKIPVSLEFRRTKVNWMPGTTHFTGWARRADGTEEGGYLMVEIAVGGRTRPPIRYSRKRLPGEIGDLWMQVYSDADVEQLLTGYEPQVLVPSGETFIEEDTLRKYSQPADAWELRARFLSLKPTVENAMAFLNEWGRWNSEKFVGLTEIVRLQALTESPAGWFDSDYSALSAWQRCPKFPYFSMVTDSAEAALRMTVTADLLDEAKFKICSRPDCGQPFKLESNHDKKFCSRACAHLVAVRRSRKAMKKDT
jgi:hypothetical protein